MKNAGKACNNRLYRHIRTFEKIIKNYFVIYDKQIIVTHIDEYWGKSYADYQKVEETLENVSFAYDGMEIVL